LPPLLEGARFDNLVADIRANGPREAILLCDGKVLDGHNRHRACVAAGVTPRSVVLRPDIDDSALAAAIAMRLDREQQERIAAEAETGRAHAVQVEASPLDPIPETRDDTIDDAYASRGQPIGRECRPGN
jgi:ParB-like chromosome segregation protein Spo0J